MSDLFAIACTTCKTRLRVRDASVIGQILACPKCSSMVLVEAPPGWEGEPAKPESATAPAKFRGGPARQALPPPPPADDAASLKETAADSNFQQVRDQGPGTRDQAGEGGTGRATWDAGLGGAAVQSAIRNPQSAIPASPPAVPAPARTQQLRLVGILAMAGSIGIALAIGAAVLAANWRGERGQGPGTGAQETGDRRQETDRSQDRGDSEQPIVESVAAVDPEPPISNQQSEVSNPESPISNQQSAISNPEPVEDPLLIVDAPPVDGEPAADPLKLDELRKLSSLLPSEEGEAPGDVPAAEAPSDTSTAVAEEPEASPSRPRPEPRKVDLAARLADPILEIEVADQPLKEVIQLLADFSTIPITLDPDSLAWSRIDPSAPVKVKLQGSTVGEVLAAVLGPFRLEATTVGDQLLVTRSSVQRSIKLPVDDLTGGDAAKTKQLVELIEAVAAPTSWKAAGGEGSIVVEPGGLLINNTELAYGQVMQLCERLRLARGSRPRNVSFPPEMFALERRTSRAATKLDLPLTLNFGQPTPLVTILDRLGEETGMHILVDWRAAGEAGWPPDADATVTLEATPLREALAKLLGPMDLTYRVVDANLLQVTTRAALEREAELEVHKLGDLAATPDDAAALIDRVLPALGDSAVIRYDAGSNALVALLSQPKQEELARLLAEHKPAAE